MICRKMDKTTSIIIVLLRAYKNIHNTLAHLILMSPVTTFVVCSLICLCTFDAYIANNMAQVV